MYGPDSLVREVTIVHECKCIFLLQGILHEGMLAKLKEEPPGVKFSKLKRPFEIKKNDTVGHITVT